ncbi:hypothetical protein A3K86_18235 [Photobacterium jeanii]|uniref:Uncharacterized protein n=1 Tax=Photobacterium jeanii TaxID=858640 RepID=A0A178K2G1_9GAMM|nr:hypothetical protein [Photobacterium jeanii]OAN10924.1 hypothetical protein A3K86_18235 [Photobacterium jeanii]PST90441.1 hypothetical protein C9I91_07335 [Photobacterium jeanii]
MRSSVAVTGLCLVSVFGLYGCGGAESGDSGSSNSAEPSQLYSHIKVENDNSALDQHGHCFDTKAKFRTDHFIVGAKGNVSDAKMQEIARIAQHTFNTDLKAYSWNSWADLSIDYAHPLEVCVLAKEGKNGAGNELGFVIGPQRAGTELEKLVKHEIKHTYQARLIGPTGLNFAHTWYAEAVATALSTNEMASNEQLNAFIAQVGMTPTQVTHDGLQQAVMLRLKDGSSEYGAYNRVLRYLKSQGASIQDFWQVFKVINQIEQSCKAVHQTALDNGEMLAPIDEKSTSCSGHAATYGSGPTRWQGMIIRGSFDDHIAPQSEPGTSLFEAAFDHVMKPYGVSYDSIDDKAAFTNTVATQ